MPNHPNPWKPKPKVKKAKPWTGPPVAHQARRVALRTRGPSPQLKQLVIRVYRERFKEAGPVAQRNAVCIMLHESGANPFTISVTSDYGTAQFNRPTWERVHPHWWRPGRGFTYLIQDPWYSASRMWAMSRRGTSWGPWYARSKCGL